MNQNWTCSRCFQQFSRKWNFERHIKFIHGQDHRNGNSDYNIQNKMYAKSKHDTTQNDSFFGGKNIFENFSNFTESINKLSNSNQTFGQINSLQLQVAALRQQLANTQSQLNGLVSSNWLMPRESIQGFSGYTCTKCQIFSLKPIFNIGYDKTMQSRHCCFELSAKRNYVNFGFPSDVQSIDDWAAQVLFSHIDHGLPLKYLYSRDLTRDLTNYCEMLGSEEVRMLGQEVVRNTVLGIPDRYYSYTIQNHHDTKWVDQTINNIGKKIRITDNEALDFLKRVKSTYAIFEIPVGNIIKQVYIGFTDL